MTENTKEIYTCEGTLEILSKPKKLNNRENAPDSETKNTYRITAMIGDRFMNGGFFSAKEAERVYKGWEGTLHDINHWGTSYPAGFTATSNILYFIGYHKNVEYNSITKEITMDIEVNPNTAYAKAWDAYVETCKMAGQTPNVSVTYMGKQKALQANELPEGVDYKSEGYSDNDLVPVLYEVEPVCVSTVLRGRCNDKDGCGIQDSCSQDEQDVTDALEKERQKIIKYLRRKEEN